MNPSLVSVITICLLMPPVASAAEQIKRTTVFSGGKTRVCYLFVPSRVKPDTPAPLIVMLHGSGRNGSPLVASWQELASKEGIILAGPDATDAADWSIPVDGPEFLRDLVESLKSKYPVDQHRVYLFGHSLGGNFALRMSLMESEYFAATAVHAAGLVPKQDDELLTIAKRKIPISLIIGTADKYYTASMIKGSRDILVNHGFPAEFTEIKGHDHDYYSRAPEINPGIWSFLRKQVLPSDQRYIPYTFNKRR